MKRLTALLMAALLVLAVCPAIAEGPVTPVIVEELPEWLNAPSQQEKTEGIVCGDFEYQLLDDGTAGIIAYTGRDKMLTLPDVLDGVPVSAIGTRAFSGNGKLTEVVIPEGITRLGNAAFSSCRKLTSVTLPNSLVQLGENPFVNCGKLTEFRLSPEHPALAVESGMLSNHAEQTLICCLPALEENDCTVPEGILTIGCDAFSGCSTLSAITLPDSLTVIGDRAFAACTSLTALELPASLKTIGEEAFRSCSALTQLHIPDGLAVIAPGTFRGCSGLTDIRLPDGLTIIGAEAFDHCTSLPSITLPKSLCELGDKASITVTSLQRSPCRTAWPPLV